MVKLSLKNGVLSSYFLISIILVSEVFIVPNSYSADDMGVVTGKVTVLKKSFFGKIQKMKNMGETVVYISGYKTQALQDFKEIKQKNNRFIPAILAVVAGQPVRFPNHDKIYHNVFSISPKATFDLGQYKGADPPQTITFEKYGVVPIYCNIHPEMIAHVVVLENNAFALTDISGAFRIENVKPGTYSINTWRLKTHRANKEIIISAGQETAVELELVEVVKIKPHRRKDGSGYPIDAKNNYED